MTRKTRKTTIFRRLYSPIKHTLLAGKETVSAVTNTAKHVTCEGLTGLDKVGRSVTRHANMAVNDLLGKRRTRRIQRYRRKHQGK
jgi:chromosomal replication initiation ATPase DnaA